MESLKRVAEHGVVIASRHRHTNQSCVLHLAHVNGQAKTNAAAANVDDDCRSPNGRQPSLLLAPESPDSERADCEQLVGGEIGGESVANCSKDLTPIPRMGPNANHLPVAFQKGTVPISCWKPTWPRKTFNRAHSR